MRCDIDSGSIGPFVRQALIRQWCARAEGTNVVPFRVEAIGRPQATAVRRPGERGTVVLFTGVRHERKA
jgi:hypothetical protein